MKNVIVTDIEIIEDGEFGRILKCNCPNCGEEIRDVQWMDCDNNKKCKCGLYWSFSIEAVGVLIK